MPTNRKPLRRRKRVTLGSDEERRKALQMGTQSMNYRHRFAARLACALFRCGCQ